MKTRLFTPIENCYIKTHHVYFNDFNILFETVCHWKRDFLQPRPF